MGISSQIYFAPDLYLLYKDDHEKASKEEEFMHEKASMRILIMHEKAS